MWRGQKGREVVESSDDKAKPTRADGKGSLRGCDSGHGFQGHCRERRSRFDRVQRDMRHLCTRAVSQLHTPHHHPPPSLQEGGKCQNAVVSRTPNSRQGQLEDVIDLRIPESGPPYPTNLPFLPLPTLHPTVCLKSYSGQSIPLGSTRRHIRLMWRTLKNTDSRTPHETPKSESPESKNQASAFL